MYKWTNTRILTLHYQIHHYEQMQMSIHSSSTTFWYTAPFLGMHLWCKSEPACTQMLFQTQEPYPLKQCDVTSYRPDHIRLDQALEDTLPFVRTETVFHFQPFNYTHRCMIKQNSGSVLQSYSLFYEMTNRCNCMQSILFHCISPLYMFRTPHTPIIRSTMFNCIYSHWYNHSIGTDRHSYFLPVWPGTDWTLYSWWWACVAPETCRVNLAVE